MGQAFLHYDEFRDYAYILVGDPFYRYTSRASLFQLFVASVRFPKDRSPLLFPTRSGVVERSIIENNVERV